ncbi:MFS transporter [Geobacter sp.]|uniref:spinster family MFS transporter n=1 Tax=Geobacter sp. TaxID=46610 RepID=UPI002607B959|nr:MFS transporter [Geobacter sp.]
MLRHDTPAPAHLPRHPSAGRYALALLLGVNLLNYIDRQVLYAVFPLIKADLALSDTALGLIGSAFMVCYMVSAPFFGWWGDRGSRPRLAAAGLALWSVATAAAGVAPGYRSLLAARAAVGIGEASFGTVSPGLLSDFFPKERRARILALFFLAIPVGSALGYLLGGLIGHRFGWHAAFLVVGLPGLALAVPLGLIREPARRGDGSAPAPDGYRSLLRNRTFVTNTLAMAAMTFALGGLAQWIPTFLFRMHGLDVARGNTLFGAITVVTGICGTLTGGWLGDLLQRRTPRGQLLVSAWGFVIGTPAAAWAILAPSLPHCLGAMFVAEFFLFLNTGPLNTVIVNVTRPTVRSMAFAVNIFFIHALGDAISPTVIGWLSDHLGLRTALLATPIAILAAALFSFLCGTSIARDMARAGE